MQRQATSCIVPWQVAHVSLTAATHSPVRLQSTPMRVPSEAYDTLTSPAAPWSATDCESNGIDVAVGPARALQDHGCRLLGRGWKKIAW